LTKKYPEELFRAFSFFAFQKRKLISFSQLVSLQLVSLLLVLLLVSLQLVFLLPFFTSVL